MIRSFIRNTLSKGVQVALLGVEYVKALAFCPTYGWTTFNLTGKDRYCVKCLKKADLLKLIMSYHESVQHQPEDPLKRLTPEELENVPHLTKEKIQEALEQGRKDAEAVRDAMPMIRDSGRRYL